MRSTSTISKRATFLFAIGQLLVLSSASAQYCSPTFAFGCFSWSNQAVHLDSINWTVDPYNCDLYDYTSLSTTLTPGVTYPMQVTNANWCGCAVYIDLNQDFAFDTTENFFHLYLANESNVYNLTITLPLTVTAGTYRMRVIAGWGSDGYTPGANGYGGCGSYQYGNFDDFTLHVTDVATGITTPVVSETPLIVISPNPASDVLNVLVKGGQPDGAILGLYDIAGRMLESRFVKAENEQWDISSLTPGTYLVRYQDGLHEQTMKVIK